MHVRRSFKPNITTTMLSTRRFQHMKYFMKFKYIIYPTYVNSSCTDMCPHLPGCPYHNDSADVHSSPCQVSWPKFDAASSFL